MRIEKPPEKISTFEKHLSLYLKQIHACCKDALDPVVAVSDEEYAEIQRSKTK